jgi:4-hydroxybenzoate polyprenyltransferase
LSNATSISQQPFFNRIRLFLALSRTPHGILDMATPALGALLWLGAFPPWPVMVLGLLTAFAGYTAVYALNDIIDYRVDKERVQFGKHRASESYLDDVLVRHPMAHGLLSFRAGLLWTVAWSLVALIGAYMLNPVCVLIFIGGCLLEIIYCLMLKVSYLRTVISGGVKTTGAVAAVFAVDPNPSMIFLFFLFLWLFLWEIGGQNIPHDWADIEEDVQLNTDTIPVRFGPVSSTALIIVTLGVAFCLSVISFFHSKIDYELIFFIAAGFAGVFFLVLPACQLYKTKQRDEAMALFNKASYYPLSLLGVVLVKLFFQTL